MAEQIDRIDARRRCSGQIIRYRHLVFRQTQTVDQQISCDMEEPGTRIVERAESLALQQCLKKNFLQQIVRFADAPDAVREKGA